MKEINRRKFLSSLSRWALSAGLIGGGGALLANRSNHRCILEKPHCKSCRVLASCARPQAMSYKQFIKKEQVNHEGQV